MEAVQWTALWNTCKDEFQNEKNMVCGSLGDKAAEDLQERIIEHNIRVVSKYYVRITVKRLAVLLCLTVEVTQQSAVFEAPELQFRNLPAVITTANAQMAISKARQGREAQNLVKVYLANLRLKGVGTDVVVTAYEPVFINPLSESASSVGAGLTVPAAQSGRTAMVEVFKQAVSSFRINDWNLFGADAV